MARYYIPAGWEKNCLEGGDKDKAVRKAQCEQENPPTIFEIRDGVGSRSP